MSDDVLQAWADTVRPAYERLPGKDAQRDAAIAGRLSAHGVYSADVTRWMQGRDAPRSEEIHDALMDALNLPHLSREQWLDDATSGATRALARQRRDVEEAYAPALEQVKGWPEYPIPQAPEPKPERLSAKKPQAHRLRVHTRTGEYEDNPALPARLHPGGAPYEDLSDKEITQLLDTTQNFHEFTHCLRVHMGHPQQAFAEKAGYAHGYSIGHYESGQGFPEWERLSALLQALPLPETYAQKAKTLYFENKLAIINDPAQSVKIRARHQDEMPPVYWRQRMDRLLDRQGWQERPHPAWAEQAPEIRTQGEYLRAMREYLGLEKEDIAKTLHYGAGSIGGIEHQNRRNFTDTAPLRAAYTELLRQCQAFRDEEDKDKPPEKRRRPFFDALVLESLPLHSPQKFADMVAAGKDDTRWR